MLPRLHIEIERWKYNPEYKIYVSSFGNIKDKNRQTIQTFVNQCGYFVVKTPRFTKNVHRLVMETFIGKSDLTVDHIDMNRRNNRLSNLEYVSAKENQKRAKTNTTVVGTKKEKMRQMIADSMAYEPIDLTKNKLQVGDTKMRKEKAVLSYLRSNAGLPQDLSDTDRLRIANYIITNKLVVAGHQWTLI